jgi:hypothetical protein
MNVQAWLAGTDPQPMLEFLHGKASERKLRLFAVACCRRELHFVENEEWQRALETAEQYADWLVHDDELEAARERIALSRDLVIVPFDALLAREITTTLVARVASWQVWNAGVRAGHAQRRVLRQSRRDLRRQRRKGDGMTTEAWVASDPERARTTAEMEERRHQCEILRCTFGNPFRPVTLDTALLRWKQGMVVQLAQAIYEERHFQDLPVLADALEDAGCTNPDLLAHFRGPGPHVLGCWGLDTVLKKE